MPAEHRVRRDQEGGSRQNLAQRRQEQAIGRSQAGPTSLPLEDSELVTGYNRKLWIEVEVRSVAYPPVC